MLPRGVDDAELASCIDVFDLLLADAEDGAASPREGAGDLS